jgi:REP element-mobilizing transposase RayT
MNEAGSRKGERKRLRIEGYDYGREGLYFVTICAWRFRCLFGRVREGVVELSAIGELVAREWVGTPALRPGVELDEWVVMPNHCHGLVLVADSGIEAGTVPQIVRGFKGATTRKARELTGWPEMQLWQRSFHDRVVRSARELEALREYVRTNALRWERDRYWIEEERRGAHAMRTLGRFRGPYGGGS